MQNNVFQFLEERVDLHKFTPACLPGGISSLEGNHGHIYGSCKKRKTQNSYLGFLWNCFWFDAALIIWLSESDLIWYQQVGEW